MRRNTHSCGIFTFAILLPLSLVLDKETHLGENHHKLVIPAAYRGSRLPLRIAFIANR
jgi:hypothetical protein